MIELTLNIVLIQTLVLGIISVILTKLISKTLISASISYWFGWSFLIIGTATAVNNGWFNNISSQSLNYISQLHFGAFIGFFVGTLLSSRPKKNGIGYYNLIYQSNFVVNKVTGKVLLILFVLGMIFLIIRIQLVGFNLNYFTNVREVFNETKVTRIGWVATHLAVIMTLIVILSGLTDAIGGMNFKRLLLITLATAPLALANGARGFLIGYLIKYLASLFMWRGLSGRYKYLLPKNEWFTIFTYIVVAMSIFSVIGFIRGGWGDKLNMAYTIIVWPTSTVGALDSWIPAALTGNSTHGLLTFGWFAGTMHRFGIMDLSSELKVIPSLQHYFTSTGNSAASIPKSIIPDLIFDFGANGVFWGMLIISFILQIISISFQGKGLVRHTLAVLSVLGAFNTIQSSVYTNEFAAIIIWVILFSLYFRYNKVKPFPLTQSNHIKDNLYVKSYKKRH